MLDTEIIETNFCIFERRFKETRDFLRKKYPNKYQEEEIKGFEKETNYKGARDALRVRESILYMCKFRWFQLQHQ